MMNRNTKEPGDSNLNFLIFGLSVFCNPVFKAAFTAGRDGREIIF